MVYEQETHGWVGEAVLPTTWRYEGDDPLAVKMVLTTTEGTVVWRFGRDLLHQALTDHEAGQGDVRMKLSNNGEMLAILLFGDGGAVMIEYDSSDLATFLHETMMLCPMGEEQIDLAEDELQQWLRG